MLPALASLAAFSGLLLLLTGFLLPAAALLTALFALLATLLAALVRILICHCFILLRGYSRRKFNAQLKGIFPFAGGRLASNKSGIE